MRIGSRVLLTEKARFRAGKTSLLGRGGTVIQDGGVTSAGDDHVWQVRFDPLPEDAVVLGFRWVLESWVTPETLDESFE